MPKSKRKRKQALTKVKPKGRERKEGLVEHVRAACDSYAHVFTFDCAHYRTDHVAEMRRELKDSRIFMGNNKVMAIALGRDKEESYKDNLWKLAKRLGGNCGLLFTNQSKKEMKGFFGGFHRDSYARAGTPATVTWTIKAGPIEKFGHEMMDQLNKLGLPVKLEHGTLMALHDTTICVEGEPLTPEATQILKLFDVKTCSFHPNLTAHWHDGVAKAIQSS